MHCSYYIPEHNVGQLRTKVAEIARKATRLGQVAPTVTECGIVLTQTLHYTDDLGRKRTEVRRFAGVTVRSEPVVVDGEWTFVATLISTAEGTLTMVVPGEALPEQYRTATNWCDHCRSARQRNETYVVRNRSGEHRQVGRNCLGDFLNGRDAQRMADWATAQSAFFSWFTTSDEGGGRDRSGAMALDEFLGYTALVVRCKGWTSKSAASTADGKTASVFRVWGLLDAPMAHTKARAEWERDNERDYGQRVPTPTPADVAVAVAATEWALGLSGQATLSDYEHNVMVLARGGMVNLRLSGLAASIVGVYVRNQQRAAQERVDAAQQATRPSEWIGREKERREFRQLTVAATRVIPCDNGPGSTLVTFRDADGNQLKWFASNPPREIVVGATLDLKATVVRHTEWKGTKETQINRAVLL